MENTLVQGASIFGIGLLFSSSENKEAINYLTLISLTIYKDGEDEVNRLSVVEILGILI